MIARDAKANGAKKISKAKFAREIGITPQNLNHHLKSGNAPPVGDVEAWVTYLAGQGRDASLPKRLREAIAKERLRLIRENVRKAKMENDVKQHELIPFALMQKFIHHLVGDIFFGELARLAQEFPAGLKGKDELGIRNVCETEIERIKTAVKDAADAWAEQKGAAEA